MPQAPDRDLRAQLTEAQLACLRAARIKLTNKNIAIELGISPNTVAQHLKEARLRLGDVTRAEAVEIVYAFDHRHPQKTISASRTIESDSDKRSVEPSPRALGMPGLEAANSVQDVQAEFHTIHDGKDPSLTWLVRHWLGSFNRELRADQTGKVIIGTALALGVITLIIIAVGESLNRTLQSLGY